MNKFSFGKSVEKAGAPSGTIEALKKEFGDINPHDVIGNVRTLIDEIDYSCQSSVDNPHPNLVYLREACTNISAMLGCLPVLMKGDRAGSILSHPELITHLPNIDVKNFGMHFGTLIEAAKSYLGASDEDVSKQDVAKQFFSMMASLISPGQEKGSLERTGKMFARKINDLLHKHVDLEGKPIIPEQKEEKN